MWLVDISVISHCFVVIFSGRAHKHITTREKKAPSPSTKRAQWNEIGLMGPKVCINEKATLIENIVQGHLEKWNAPAFMMHLISNL